MAHKLTLIVGVVGPVVVTIPVPTSVVFPVVVFEFVVASAPEAEVGVVCDDRGTAVDVLADSVSLSLSVSPPPPLVASVDLCVVVTFSLPVVVVVFVVVVVVVVLPVVPLSGVVGIEILSLDWLNAAPTSSFSCTSC